MLHPCTQEVGGAIVLGVWWKGTDMHYDAVEAELNVCGLPVGVQWSVKFSLRMSMRVLEKTGLCCFGRAGIASSHRNTSNGHFQL